MKPKPESGSSSFRLMVRISDYLAERLKVRAMKEKRTLQEVTADALEAHLRTPLRRDDQGGIMKQATTTAEPERRIVGLREFAEYMDCDLAQVKQFLPPQGALLNEERGLVTAGGTVKIDVAAW